LKGGPITLTPLVFLARKGGSSFNRRGGDYDTGRLNGRGGKIKIFVILGKGNYLRPYSEVGGKRFLSGKKRGGQHLFGRPPNWQSERI